MNRRQFLRLGCMSGLGLLVTACADERARPSPTGVTHSAEATTTVAPPTTTLRGFAAPGTVMRNENVPGFYVRYINDVRAPDPGRWQLRITGLVDAPTTLTLQHISDNLPRRVQNSRMKCVECWSSRAVWGGFTYADLAALVKPQAAAVDLRFICEDEYWEVLPISELVKPGALFVTHMDGRALPAKYGAPLRLLIPWLYGYKSPKIVNEVQFSASGGTGFWPQNGPYTAHGRIMPGWDLPLDLDGKRREIRGGEITDY